MKTHYQVTFGYKAIITVDVRTVDETQAKEIANNIFKVNRDKMFNNGQLSLQDDNFKPDGILNMDETWNQL